MGQGMELSSEAQGAFRKEALPWIENVRRFAHSLCHDAPDSDDLVQETYLRAYQSWHTFQAGTDCRQWLFTICRNVFRRQRRDARMTESLAMLTGPADLPSGTSALDLDAGGSSETDDDLFTQLDVSTAIDAALPLVPEPYRSALVLVLLEDQSYEMAATQLDVPVGTIRSRLSRARRLVRGHLVRVAQDAGIVAVPGTAASPTPRASATARDRRRRGDEYRTHQSDVEARPRSREQHGVHAEPPGGRAQAGQKPGDEQQLGEPQHSDRQRQPAIVTLEHRRPSESGECSAAEEDATVQSDEPGE